MNDLYDSIRKLLLLKEDWHAGTGIAPKKEHVELLITMLMQYYPYNLRLPSVAPGNIIFEWMNFVI